MAVAADDEIDAVPLPNVSPEVSLRDALYAARPRDIILRREMRNDDLPVLSWLCIALKVPG